MAEMVIRARCLRGGLEPVALALSALCVLAAAGASQAARVENRLAGSVLSVSGVAQSALAALGVREGAATTVEFEVESSTPGTASSAGVSYLGAITGWRVEIGGFVAVLDPLRFNQVIVSNDVQSAPGLPKVDLYSAAGEMDTIDDVLGPFASVAMSLAEFGNRAIDDSAVDQDLSRFDTASIALAGPEGAISILLGGKVPPPPPEPACVRSQLQIGAKLAVGAVACLAKRAKRPALDLARCIDKAERRFVAAFDAARAKADRKGRVCTSVLNGTGAALTLALDLDLLDALVSDSADPDSKADRKYRASLLEASEEALEKALEAYGVDARKPNARKLDKRLAKNDAALGREAEKAAAKAARKGLVPDVATQDLVDAVNELARAVVGIARGSD